MTTCGLTPARGCGSCDSCLGKGPGPMRNTLPAGAVMSDGRHHPNPGYASDGGLLGTLWGFPVALSVEVRPGTMIAVSGALKFDARTCKVEVDHEVVLHAIDHYQQAQRYSHDVSDVLKGLPLERGE